MVDWMQKTNDEIGEINDFYRLLSSLERETDNQTAISGYKALLKVNLDIDINHYQKIIGNLCVQLNLNKLYGEELYSRFIVRYFTDSVIKIDQGIISAEIIGKLYGNCFRELQANPKKLNVIIVSVNSHNFQPLIQIVKNECLQEVIVVLEANHLVQLSDQFMQNYDILIVCDENKKIVPDKTLTGQTLNIFGEYRNKFTHPLLTAVFCKNSEIAKYYYWSHNKEIAYCLYSDTMIYALLHMALKGKKV
jgi:hypothetical protein